MSDAARAAEALRTMARELEAGDVAFPTHVDTTLRIRRALGSSDLGAEGIARAIATEPVLSAKVVRLANSVALNPHGNPVRDVRTAVTRVGTMAVHSLATAVLMQQLAQAPGPGPQRELARKLWEHSVHVAAIAHVVAGRGTGLHPDEALFAGIVHEIGQFYLLAHAGEYPELLDDHSELSALMYDMDKTVARAVLGALSVPEAIIEAVDDTELYGQAMPPRSLGDVMFVANSLTPYANPFNPPDEWVRNMEARQAALGLAESEIAQLITDSGEELQSLILSLEAGA